MPCQSDGPNPYAEAIKTLTRDLDAATAAACEAHEHLCKLQDAQAGSMSAFSICYSERTVAWILRHVEQDAKRAEKERIEREQQRVFDLAEAERLHAQAQALRRKWAP